MLVVVLVVVGAGVGALAWFTGRALPQTSGTLTVPGLERPVTVVRDVAGIAHIRAETVHDLFMAQGFVHAQERMWQMEVWRHISAGRLAEMFGESQLDTDRFIRTLGWRQATERDLAAMAPDARAVLDAYAQGVNAWLDQERDSLGLAFLLTGTKPEPWTPLDSVGWQKVQAWNVGANMDEELFRYLADARLGDPARTDELFPPYPDGAPVIVPGPGDTADAADARVPSRSIRHPSRDARSAERPAGARSPISAIRSGASRGWTSVMAWSARMAWARTTGSSRRA